MKRVYFGVGAVVTVLAVTFCVYLVGSKFETKSAVSKTTAITTVFENEPNEKDVPTQDNTEIINLIEADIASTTPRTLEITAWQKLSNQRRFEFLDESIEIWFPEEWFTYYSVGSGAGSSMSLYRWPEDVERIEENKGYLLTPYLQDLAVVNIWFLNYGSRVASLTENYLQQYTPYISFKDTISEITVSGLKAKKYKRVLSKPDNTSVTEYSLVIENIPYGFSTMDISISDDVYTNAEEILDKIAERIVFDDTLPKRPTRSQDRFKNIISEGKVKKELGVYYNNHGYSIQHPADWKLYSDNIYEVPMPEDFGNVILSGDNSRISMSVSSPACDEFVEIQNGKITLIRKTDMSEDFFIYCLPLADYVKTLWEYNINDDVNSWGKVVSDISEVEIGGLKGYRFDTNVSFANEPTGRYGFTLAKTNSFYFFQLNENKFTVQFETNDKRAQGLFETLIFY